MRRIVRGAALAGGCAAAAFCTAGCGADRPTGDPSTARLTAAVLSKQDLPSDYLPAGNQQVFRGLGPAEPSCRRLLDLADLRGLRDVPQTHAFFYRANPGSTLAEHLVTPGRARVQAYLQAARKAADGCQTMMVHEKQEVRLHRRKISGLPTEVFGVRYAGPADARHSINFDVVMAPFTDGLMIFAQPGLVDDLSPGHSPDAEHLALTAIQKVQAAHL